MRDFLSYLETKICFFLTPKHILFDEYEAEPIKGLIKNDFKDINKYFNKEEALILVDFFNNFGQGLKDEQISLCQYTRTRIEERTKKAEGELKNKVKVFRTLALFIGASVTILII